MITNPAKVKYLLSFLEYMSAHNLSKQTNRYGPEINAKHHSRAPENQQLTHWVNYDRKSHMD